MSEAQTQLPTDTWTYASWEEYVNAIANLPILPGLAIAILEAALRRSREINQSEVGAWLLSQFQQYSNSHSSEVQAVRIKRR